MELYNHRVSTLLLPEDQIRFENEAKAIDGTCPICKASEALVGELNFNHVPHNHRRISLEIACTCRYCLCMTEVAFFLDSNPNTKHMRDFIVFRMQEKFHKEAKA